MKMKNAFLTLLAGACVALVLFAYAVKAAPIDEYRGTLLVGNDNHIGTVYHRSFPTETLTVTNVDAINNTLSVAELIKGITVHTSVTSACTVTTDTALLIIAGSAGQLALTLDDQCYKHYYINDGDQTCTFAGGTGVTVSDTGNTVLTNEAAVLLFCRASSTTVTMHIVSS